MEGNVRGAVQMESENRKSNKQNLGTYSLASRPNPADNRRPHRLTALCLYISPAVPGRRFGHFGIHNRQLFAKRKAR